jgi:hypothetical protein
MAGAGVALGFALAPSSYAGTSSTGNALQAPQLSEACHIPPFAFVRYVIQSGHAVSGVWTLEPRLTCTQPKTGMSIKTTLLRNGAPQFASKGACQAYRLSLCTSASGPRVHKSYGTSIRASWSADVEYSVGGPDAILFARSSASAGTCTYNAPQLRAVCHYRTVAVVLH